MNRRSLARVFVASSVTLVACGGDYAPAKSGGSPAREAAPEPEPTTVEEAQKQIARAADELSARPVDLKAAEKPEATKSPSTPPPAAEPAPKSRTEDYSTDTMTHRCESPCRALASMRRAVEALCRMTGEGDTKCVDARRTLADNVGKTASCKCAS